LDANSRLGRPKNDPELVAAERRQFVDDQRRRNAVEGKIGQGKRRYGLGLTREKLPATQGSSIAMNALVKNLQKLLELFCLFFVLCWQLLVSAARALSANRRGLSCQLSGA
jgi:IS5 family transposase